MKKRINLRLILIAGIAVIVTMVCMTGIYYKLFQGQVRKDLQINARLLSGTGLFDDPDNTNVSLSEYYEVGEDLRVTWIAKDGTVLRQVIYLTNHFTASKPQKPPGSKEGVVSGGGRKCPAVGYHADGQLLLCAPAGKWNGYPCGNTGTQCLQCVPCGIPICDADTDTDCFHLYCPGTFFDQTIAASD